MQDEALAFGGSGLDRASCLREQLSGGAATQEGEVVVLWHGRVLFEDSTLSKVARINSDHAILAGGVQERIFLGREERGTLVFAQEVNDWSGASADALLTSGHFDRATYVHPGMPRETVFADLRTGMSFLNARDCEIAATARGLFAWHETHQFCAACGHASQMKAAGWERRCPDCARRHFPRTDPVVIMLITRGNSVLVGRSPGWPERMYSFLAGFMEPGETVAAAVRREVAEETAIRVGEVSYLLSQPWPFPSSLMIGCWGQALSEKIEIDPSEIEDARWVTREKMMEAFAGQSSDILPARPGSTAQFILTQWLADRL